MLSGQLTAEDVRSEWYGLRDRSPRQLQTNFFGTPSQLDEWIARGVVTLVGSGQTDGGTGAVLLLVREPMLVRVYHAYDDAQRLPAALAKLPVCELEFVGDLVGRRESLGETLVAYERSGFGLRTTLVRLRRAGGMAVPAARPSPAEVFQAGLEWAARIGAFLEALLDPLVDRIPTPLEIRQSASQGHILLVTEGPFIQGLLWMKPGRTAMLRYWYVDPRLKNQGIGARLMKAFLRACGASERVLLWAVENNFDSLARYEHYGFRKENLIDHIVVRRKAW